MAQVEFRAVVEAAREVLVIGASKCRSVGGRSARQCNAFPESASNDLLFRGGKWRWPGSMFLSPIREESRTERNRFFGS